MPETQLVRTSEAGWTALKNLAVQAMPAEASKRVYSAALDHFHQWYFAGPRPAFGRTVVQQYRAALEKDGYAPATVAIHISALRKLAEEAALNGLLDFQAAAGVWRLRGPRRLGRRLGNWLGVSEAEALICVPGAGTLKGVRDQAILCLAIGCGLRRGEIAGLAIEHLQLRNGRWLIVDLMGKHRRIRTVPVPDWVKRSLDAWLERAEIRSGRVFRTVNKAGRIGEPSLTRRRYTRSPKPTGIELDCELLPTICAGPLRNCRAKEALRSNRSNTASAIPP